MAEILRPFVAPPTSEDERPYLPFLPAVQRGIVDFGELVMRHLPDPIGVTLANLRMPQQNDAGIVPIDPEADKVVAVDHTRLLDVSNRAITLGPSSKDAVDKQDGHIRHEGLLTITTPEGLLRAVGVVMDRFKNPWLAQELGAARTAGRLAVVRFGLDVLDYEVTDVDTETGSLSAKPRTKLY